MLVPESASYSRRGFLSVLGLSIASGCLSISETESNPPGLASLYIRNQRPQKTKVAVDVQRNDETVYTETHSLAAETDHSFGEVLIEEEWLGEQVPYEVNISAEGVGEESYSTADFLKIAGGTENFNCYEVTVVIDTDFIDFRPSARETCPSW